MSDARWQRLQELFAELAALSPARRAAWLAEVDADEELKREALALVEADESGPDRGLTAQLQAASARAAMPQPLDRRIGAYRITDEIGSGGMGAVFLAERVDEAFDQRVAIKLLRGIPTRESTERMRRERQILADLAHPHIARLLDGGSTADGQPYLVMEYVDGVPLNEFCRRRDLPLAARLRLIQKICAAVQYAHQRLVIHRDLKPANVLVRTDGEPVLLDFGIAKLLAETDRDAEQTGVPWFTPAYASPEQVRRERVSTATDVYGLGVLLYEVLAELPPAPVDGRLPPPSRSGRLPVDRELDLIVAKATHAEPERRYVSAAALAEDLQRHLRGRPIHAVPDRLHYRMAKFVRRHKLASAAAAAAVAMAVLFTWRLAQERDRALRAEAVARQQSATAESVVDSLVALFRSASPEQAGTQPIAPRDLVDRGRREIDQRLADAPQQHARLLGALGKIYLEIGLSDEAAEALGKAAEIERAHGTPQQRAGYLADQGYALNLSERPANAEAVLGEAVAALGEVAPDERRLAAQVFSTLGLAQARNGNPGAGEASIRRALDYAAGADGSDSVTYARCLYALAEAELRGNRIDAAEQDALRSVAAMRALLPEDSPDVLAATGFLTEVYEQQGRYADGERLLRHMLDVRLRTLDPGSAWAVTVRNNLAQAIQLQGRIVEATALMQENLAFMRANRQQRTPSYLIGLNNVASLLEQAGDYTVSLPMFREVFDTASAESAQAEDPHMPTYRQNLGRSLMLNGQLEAARPFIEAAVEGGADSKETHIEQGRRLLHLAEWLRRSHRYDEALAQADEAAVVFGTIYPPTHPRFGAVARTRGLVQRDRNRLPEAEAELRRAAGILSAAGADSNATIETEMLLAEILLARGAADEAAHLATRVAPLMDARFAPQSPQRTQYAALSRRLAERKPIAMR